MRTHTDPFYLTIAAKIKSHDRMILGVGPDGRLPPFFYTIGNHLHGLPELLIIGPFNPDACTGILNTLSRQMAERQGKFVNGELANMGGEHSLQVWDATPVAKLQYTLQATEYFGHKDYAVQQCVLPDPKGRYPGDKRVHRIYKVPVLRATAEIMQSLRVH
jgi:hypothetical protein